MTGAFSAEFGVKSPPVLGRLEDGTPYFARMGELVVDQDRDRVHCHPAGIGTGHWRLAIYALMAGITANTGPPSACPHDDRFRLRGC